MCIYINITYIYICPDRKCTCISAHVHIGITVDTVHGIEMHRIDCHVQESHVLTCSDKHGFEKHLPPLSSHHEVGKTNAQQMIQKQSIDVTHPL